MGQYLNRIEDDTATSLKKAETELAELTQSKEWQTTKTAADIAGIADPSPTADTVSLGMSVAEGDWLGAFLSGVSFVPYLGDAVAKPVKIIRTTKTIENIEKRAAALAKTIDHYKSAATRISQRKMAAAAERARRAKEATEKYAKRMKCTTCPKPKQYGTQLPAPGKGKWTDAKGNPGERGNSRWTSDDGSVSLDYKEGYPDFSTSNPPSVYPKGDGKVEIEMQGNDTDFLAARDAMRDKLDDPTWPGGRNRRTPEGYTWHHNEDGTTMQLVRTEVHDKAVSGAAHSGGASIVSGKDTQF
ncbi:MAG: HNH endonuclease [Methylobacter sp.]|uniref:HNH endonuclease n=1 Tax=Methylobacter sp. TaxID=2051955 RepID=UPI00258CE7AE|nr:HNH endonuclease [Methylobacter sp.]MCL7421748.1 HNH endonuclease [Methylobacter sp.]